MPNIITKLILEVDYVVQLNMLVPIVGQVHSPRMLPALTFCTPIVASAATVSPILIVHLPVYALVRKHPLYQKRKACQCFPFFKKLNYIM